MKVFSIFLFSILTTSFSFAQSNLDITSNLKKNIEFLASDKLEGRRVGTAGEEKAYKMIVKNFRKAGLTSPTGIKNYLQPFEVSEGKYLGKKNELIIGNKRLQLNEDYFPTTFSGTAIINGQSSIRLIDIQNLKKEAQTNPHFDFNNALLQQIKKFESEKNSFIILHNDDDGDFKSFDGKKNSTTASIPVVYIKKNAFKNLNLVDNQSTIIKYEVDVQSKLSIGHNVVGYINNNKPYTVVIGAHYDHLGYGEDNNSLYTGKEKMIHNGADDNASGTAALIELAKSLKTSTSKTYNYLFVAFSGEELGLFGSKYFVDNNPIANDKINYMINMDMVGRLNPETKALAIGGFGTSPSWEEKIKITDNYFKIKIDSSGSGPSDHTSFYRKNIPVLFFFTGTHSDYHKPSDDAEKLNMEGEVQIINYIKDLIAHYDSKPKLNFLKTREAQMGRSSFKVSLGIFPDYTYSGKGVRVDGVTEGRAAEKAGVKVGDVLLRLGDHEFTDVMSYMSALNKFDKGNATKLILMRNNQTLTVNIIF